MIKGTRHAIPPTLTRRLWGAPGLLAFYTLGGLSVVFLGIGCMLALMAAWLHPDWPIDHD